MQSSGSGAGGGSGNGAGGGPVQNNNPTTAQPRPGDEGYSPDSMGHRAAAHAGGASAEPIFIYMCEPSLTQGRPRSLAVSEAEGESEKSQGRVRGVMGTHMFSFGWLADCLSSSVLCASYFSLSGDWLKVYP